MWTAIITIVISGIITDNIIFSQTLGICPFLGVSKKLDSAVGMGLAVTFVIVLSSVVCHFLYMLLELLELTYLQTILFILIIAALVQLLDIVLKRVSPSLYTSLGVYLALITTNCAVLGTANSVVANGYGLLETFIAALSVGLYARAHSHGGRARKGGALVYTQALPRLPNRAHNCGDYGYGVLRLRRTFFLNVHSSPQTSCVLLAARAQYE